MHATRLLLLLLALVALFATAAPAVIIDPDIAAAFARNEAVDIFVHLPFFEFSGPKAEEQLTRPEKRTLVHAQLLAHNAKYQPKLQALLEELGLEYRTFWIVNSILVKAVTEGAFPSLASFPTVVELEADKISAHIIDASDRRPFSPKVAPASASASRRVQNGTEWNVEIINAPAAWSYTLGKGITVGGIDSGVRHTHEALRDNYRGNSGGGGVFNHNYNWHDPQGRSREPQDTSGHGTHTMGTIAGSVGSGIGVAPGVKWIAARGCMDGCSTSDLLSSSEFVLCPTDLNNKDPDCSLGADVVCNSWGGGRGSTTFRPAILAWVEAGMVPLFAQGNSGPSCSTGNSPGDLDVAIAVGATDQKDSLAALSSRGPGLGSTYFPLQKPDITAPGQGVRSAASTSDTGYVLDSGSSMACPAVAGVAALLLSKNSTLTVDQVRAVITQTAKTNLPPPTGGQRTCGGVEYSVYPNYHYGHGRVDALAAILAV